MVSTQIRPAATIASLAVLLALATAAHADSPAVVAPPETGYVALFDGKTLDGWQGATQGYAVEEGVLVCKKQGGGKLFTEKEYGDFSLRFEFKLAAGGNNGVGIRAPLKGDPAYAGMEVQILDDTSPKYAKLKPYQYHGSIYGVVAAEKGHQRPLGEWNEEEIICHGNQITVKLNGHTIVDADIEKASTPQTLDGKNHPGLKRTEGHIGFLGHGHRIEFRSVRIKELP
jgi:hypothetical protein